MRIAVTGASGFVGEYVLTELMRYTDLDIVVLAHDARGMADGLALLPQSHRIQVVPFELHAPASKLYVEIGKPDAMIHLAWSGLPNYLSLHHFETELPAQYRFLSMMIDAGLKSLLVTGTCFEYGDQSGGILANSLTQPTNPYGYAKDALYKQLRYLQKHSDFDLTWARLFYMYGPGQGKNSLYTLLSEAAQRGDTSFDMSGGEQLRDFLPVQEVATRLVKLIMNPDDRGAVNICHGKPTSVRNLAEAWCQQYDWKIQLNFGRLPYPTYEPMAFWGLQDELF
jgi:nucleoside-diphosphate-sugar epimerase